jgi:5'-phosphate synthase pdxT subunit
LAERVEDGRADQVGFGGLDITVRRNGYGRQRFSFEASVAAPALGSPFVGVFIRAPKIVEAKDVEVLGTLDGEPVLVKSGAVIGCAFHPELTDDDRLHALLLAGL